MRDEGVESRKVIEQIRESRQILPSSRLPQWQEMGSLKLFVLSISCSPGRTSRLAHQAIYGQSMEGPICRVSKDSPSGMDSFIFDITGKTRHRRSGTYTPYNVSNPPGSYSPLETSNPDHAFATRVLPITIKVWVCRRVPTRMDLCKVLRNQSQLHHHSCCMTSHI